MKGVKQFTATELARAGAYVAKQRAANERFLAADNPRDYWNSIRQAWAEAMPMVEAGTRLDPYFLSWKFTPIEELAWNYIRSNGMRFYPQVPVGRVFLDFGDPHRKIGIELDGKDYHDAERDAIRDERLWACGWRVFRITGSKAYKWVYPPSEPGFANDASYATLDYWRALATWAHSTGEGVLWAIKRVYYPKFAIHPQERAIALGVAEAHRGIEFPLGVAENNSENTIREIYQP